MHTRVCTWSRMQSVKKSHRLWRSFKDGPSMSAGPSLCGHPLTGGGSIPPSGRRPSRPRHTRDPPLLPTCITMHRHGPAKLPDNRDPLGWTTCVFPPPVAHRGAGVTAPRLMQVAACAEDAARDTFAHDPRRQKSAVAPKSNSFRTGSQRFRQFENTFDFRHAAIDAVIATTRKPERRRCPEGE